ncbi:MAG: hypothetical protein KDK34_02555, partial [Leptospiraceae bacterium]|nr:hypothetical protein [Leptospiraceae bacterium]
MKDSQFEEDLTRALDAENAEQVKALRLLESYRTKLHGKLVLVSWSANGEARGGYSVGKVQEIGLVQFRDFPAAKINEYKAEVQIGPEVIVVLIEALTLLSELIPLGKSLWA